MVLPQCQEIQDVYYSAFKEFLHQKWDGSKGEQETQDYRK